jgi:hypothetical protein
MNPHALENLYVRWGRPAWFWPAVMLLLSVLWVIGSSLESPV